LPEAALIPTQNCFSCSKSAIGKIPNRLDSNFAIRAQIASKCRKPKCSFAEGNSFLLCAPFPCGNVPYEALDAIRVSAVTLSMYQNGISLFIWAWVKASMELFM
jgi:hypothetical protein